jgi:uncharacterized membrane protein YhaH (DUF805 family)
MMGLATQEEAPMDFKQAVITCFRKYADFSGRAGRSEFWWFVLFTVIAGMVAGILGKWATVLVNLALLVPSVAVGTRRFHDVDKSGWFQLLWLIPVIGWAILIYFLALPSGPPNRHGPGPALPGDVKPAPPGTV